MQKIIYTIGHSTRTTAAFTGLLETYAIELVADVRRYPGSRRYPHFNKENLLTDLAEKGILYEHLPNLGGRRKASPQSKNIAWENDGFRGYADYMETEEFRNGVDELETAALKYPTAFMCSEAVWWQCHRSMIADYLKAKEWKVQHILNSKKLEEHPYTSVAKIVDGQLSYHAGQQRLF